MKAQTLFEKVRTHLVQDLQKVHDNHSPRTWENYLGQIARRYNLEAITSA